MSGYGSHVICKYDVNWSPYLLILVLACILVAFDKGRSKMDKLVPHGKCFSYTMHSCSAELDAKGFVSPSLSDFFLNLSGKCFVSFCDFLLTP